MDYREAHAVFFQPPAEERTAPPLPDTPARRLRDAIEPIATISFWGRSVNDRLAALGHDFLTGYVAARSAPMGTPTAPVVVAAFGVFEPGLLSGLYQRALGIAGREAVLEAREQGAVEDLRALLPGADVTGVVAVLRRATDAAAADLVARPLFAGGISLPQPRDPLGQLWHAATLLREYRGDVHLAATAAAGISGLEANLLTEYWVGYEPRAYAGTRGWSPEAMDAADAALADRGLVADGRLTAEGRRLRDDIEARTDAAMAAVLAAVEPDLDGVVGQLDGWSSQIVAGGGAPPDMFKRICG